MKVRAKWSIKDGTGWHNPGEVFETESDLGDAVEVLEAQKQPEPEIVNVPEPAEELEPAEEAEPKKEPAKPRSTTRRKVSTAK